MTRPQAKQDTLVELNYLKITAIFSKFFFLAQFSKY